VVGASKGAELALLAAATFPARIGAVVAYAPGAVVFAGIEFRLGGVSRRSSWTFRDKPVPFAPYPPHARPSLSLRGVSFAPMYEAALGDEQDVCRAAIPVEQIDGPIMLVSGDNDRMWPASRMAHMITARLAERDRGDRVTHLRYADAGHRLAPRFRPATGIARLSGVLDLGGSPQANRAASDDAWPKVISFLNAALPQ
jgi:dienelactone hydrolase